MFPTSKFLTLVPNSQLGPASEKASPTTVAFMQSFSKKNKKIKELQHMDLKARY